MIVILLTIAKDPKAKLCIFHQSSKLLAHWCASIVTQTVVKWTIWKHISVVVGLSTLMSASLCARDSRWEWYQAKNISTKDNPVDMLIQMVTRAKCNHCKNLLRIFQVCWDLLRSFGWSMCYLISWAVVRKQPSRCSPFAELKLTIRCVQLRFEKSSPRWRIVWEKIKNGVFKLIGVSPEKEASSSSNCESSTKAFECWHQAFESWKLISFFESLRRLSKALRHANSWEGMQVT